MSDDMILFKLHISKITVFNVQCNVSSATIMYCIGMEPWYKKTTISFTKFYRSATNKSLLPWAGAGPYNWLDELNNPCYAIIGDWNANFRDHDIDNNVCWSCVKFLFGE